MGIDTPEIHDPDLEEAEKTSLLTVLQTRFSANTHLHEGIDWNDVKTSLEANPEALWSLTQMEVAGHEPDIYHNDDSNYYFGTCSEESPESARNCVYDKEAADFLKENYPDEKFNDSAVEMAEAMGIELMSPEHYRDILQEKGRFKETWSWLLTPSDVRSTGYAFRGFRHCNDAGIYRNIAHSYYYNGTWRGSLRVKKVTT